MMAVKVGSARIDENGKTHGGKAGDQNGKEVSTQAWYRHKKGWRVLRCKSADKADKIARAMQAACDNANIGYDQYQRDTLYNLAKTVDFDPARSKRPAKRTAPRSCACVSPTRALWSKIFAPPTKRASFCAPANLLN